MTLQQEATDALAEMYSNLKEEDMWAGVWQKKAKYNETSIAIAYEQQGFFEQAQGAYELVRPLISVSHWIRYEFRVLRFSTLRKEININKK